ncbi:MAG: hypothetical protein Ct9H300mP14_07240 [Gammaproteobacteria bacterium]|nr:MAG: hypothetical protein Ct9H300mP14_07240 [Gammaproteobacteria bacterium]
MGGMCRAGLPGSSEHNMTTEVLGPGLSLQASTRNIWARIAYAATRADKPKTSWTVARAS